MLMDDPALAEAFRALAVTYHSVHCSADPDLGCSWYRESSLFSSVWEYGVEHRLYLDLVLNQMTAIKLLLRGT